MYVHFLGVGFWKIEEHDSKMMMSSTCESVMFQYVALIISNPVWFFQAFRFCRFFLKIETSKLIEVWTVEIHHDLKLLDRIGLL